MSPCCDPSTSSLHEIYDPDHVRMIHHFVDHLDEKQRRLFFGLEAVRLGHGGRKRLVEEFSTSFGVISQGEEELRHPELLPEAIRVRHPGGGRKCIEDQQPEVLDALESIMEGHIAGDPMNAAVRWTDLNLTHIREKLRARGFSLSDKTVTRLVKKTTRSRSPSKTKR